MNTRERISSFLWYSYRKIKLESNHNKTSDKFNLKDILQSNWAVLFKNVKVLKDKERQRKCSILREPKET